MIKMFAGQALENQADQTVMLIWNLFSGGEKSLKLSSYVILNWFYILCVHSGAGISGLAFVCIHHETFVI